MNFNYTNSRLFLAKFVGFLAAILMGAYIPHATAQDNLNDTAPAIKTGTPFSGDSITGEYNRYMTNRCGRSDAIWCWKPVIDSLPVQPVLIETFTLDPSGDLTLSATRYSKYEYGRGFVYRTFHYLFNPSRPSLDGVPTSFYVKNLAGSLSPHAATIASR